ncbi:MAG: flippase [Bacteroidaceae bacterium]|nr:flippase [Bacteroidaceae bacterium]MBR3733098.1 flippase [Bacteroidaceae bacterium]
MKFSLSGNKQKIVNNLLWAVGGKVVNLVGSLVLGIIVARYLGVEQYGLMNYVISYAFLFQTLASFGLDSIEVREEAAGKVPVNTIIGTAFWIKVVFGVICIALSIGTAVVMSEDGYTIGLVALYSSYIVFNSFVVIRNYFTSLVQNKYIVLSEIFRTFVGIAIKLTMWATDCSLTWFVAAFAFDHVLLAGGYISSYRHKIGKLKEWRFSLPYAKYLLKESFPLLLTNAAVIIYQRIDQVMIGHMVSKADVGYFSVAAKFVEVMIFIPATIAHTISPILVQMLDKSREIYTVKAQQYLNITVWVSILCSIGVSVISYWIVLHTFGTQYLHAAAILQVLSFKMVSVALSNGGGIMVIVERLQKWVFFRDVLGCLVCIGLNWWLLPLYGAMAAAFVAIAANLAAGYIADLLAPAYRHIFRQQTKALLLGWRDLVHIKQLLKS